jgi:hypothetical protein
MRRSSLIAGWTGVTPACILVVFIAPRVTQTGKTHEALSNLISVVSSINVSRRTDIPEPPDWKVKAQRKIATVTPLYPVDDVKALLKKGVLATSLFTVKCGEDVSDEGLSLSDVIAIVSEAIEHGRYKGAQWCRQSETTPPIAPCDAYSIRRMSSKGVVVPFYVKFAISSTGNLLLLFSCHP